MDQKDQELLHTWAVTAWSGVFQGRGEGDTARQARNDLLLRYHEAVYRYFLRTIRDPHEAGELYGTFALKLLETDRLLKSADPARGRFRNYLRTALHHMVMDHYRRKGGKSVPFDSGLHNPIAPGGDDDFSPVWRQELLNQAWKALQALERQTGQPHYSVLRCQTDHPEFKAAQLAELLGTQFGRPFTPEAVRQALHRAREKFATLLLEEVERSLESPNLDDLEAELIDQQLLPCCKRALEKRRQHGSGDLGAAANGVAKDAASGLHLEQDRRAVGGGIRPDGLGLAVQQGETADAVLVE
jgi:RNA polymerase sigma-70 factor (ECF subfamily)